MSKNSDATIALLEKHFDIAFAAPDGIKKLRELISSLAMQGKLVPQDPKDQPASELLKEIEAEKERLIKDGKIKKSKPLLEIKPDEVPYKLPKSWEWVRLGNFGTWKSGTTPSRTNHAYYGGEIPWVKSGEVKQGRIRDTEEKITYEALQNCSLELNSIGSVLVAMYGANIGEVGVLEIEATTNQAVCACKTFLVIDNIFLLHLITSLKQNFLTQGAGAAQPNISREKIINTVVPLPPLAEQRRIVAKIDELMTRCDELERLRGDRDRKQITVHTAALNRLLMAKEQSDFNTASQFITQHFSELYSVKENVSELRKAILQLAVMGKLVPQDPLDVPAAILLKEIRKRVNELVYQKEEREIKFEPINAEDEAFLLPESWLWVRLGSLLQNIKYGTAKKCAYDSPGTAVLRIPNINVEDGCIDVKNLKYTHLSEAELKELYLKPFDLLIIRSNGSESLVGRSAVVSETEEGLAYAGYLVRLRLFSEYAYSPYICHALNTLFVRKQIEQPLRTTSGVKNINSKEIANLLLPLPSFPEQRRIVAEIDKLMVLCDNLEKQIDSANSKQTDLLNAVITKI